MPNWIANMYSRSANGNRNIPRLSNFSGHFPIGPEHHFLTTDVDVAILVAALVLRRKAEYLPALHPCRSP